MVGDEHRISEFNLVQICRELLDDDSRTFPGRAQFLAFSFADCCINKIHHVPLRIRSEQDSQVAVPLPLPERCFEFFPGYLVGFLHVPNLI